MSYKLTAATFLVSVLICATAQSAAALSLDDFGKPSAFTEKNRSEYTVGFLKLKHRFVAVFGGKCEGPLLPPVEEGGPKPPLPPEPKPGPKPEPQPKPEPRQGRGVITPLPDGGQAEVELLDAKAERSVQISGFDPLSEPQVVAQLGGNDNGAGNADDGGNADNNIAGNNVVNNTGGGNVAPPPVAPPALPQTASDTLGPPPSTAYFQIADDGSITVLPGAGGETIQVGTDNATTAFIFPNNGFAFLNPPVAPGLSLQFPINTPQVVLIGGPAGQLFRVTVTVTLGQATITVEVLTL